MNIIPIMGQVQNMPTRHLKFRFSSWSGLDFWRNLFPEKLQARWLAKKLVRGPYKGFNFAGPAPLLIEMFQTWRVLDHGTRWRLPRVEGFNNQNLLSAQDIKEIEEQIKDVTP